MDLDSVRTECLKWIQENKFKRVVIQFKREELKYSSQISKFLTKAQDGLEVYVTQSNTCCVDLLVTQHISDVDGIIHVGSVCISKPEIKCDEANKPVLFVFGRPNLSLEQFRKNTISIMDEIDFIRNEKGDSKICLLYDTSLISYATSLEDTCRMNNVEVARIFSPKQDWYTTSDVSHLFVKSEIEDERRLGFYVLSSPISQYDCAIYLGQNISIQISLKGPNNLWKISETAINGFKAEMINLTRLLNKRIALVERLKDEEELKIGIIITNPLPNIDRSIIELETYAEARKHILYFISMIQTTDEYKIGNFDLCDAFVIINSCCCSTILESLVFNRPILTDLEFKLACGFEAEYGRIVWPGSSGHLSEDDMMNKRKVSDVSLALVHTRNMLLERCAQARINKWSGMDFKATSGSGEVESESLDIEEGLTGIASSYQSEPIKKFDNKSTET